MKKFKFNKILKNVSMGFLFLVLGFSVSNIASAATSPTLGGSAAYSVLGHSRVTNTGTTTTAGEVGVSTGTSITGFPPGVAALNNTFHLHSNDASAAAAQLDNTAAYGFLDTGTGNTVTDCLKASDGSSGTDTGSQDLAGKSLAAGTYCAEAFTLSGTLNLTGSGVWVFKSGSTLITSGTANIVGGDACNVWWRVVSSATLGSGTSLIGNILALASITFVSGANLNGRAMAQTGAVTLDTNIISGSSCIAPLTSPHLTLDKIVSGGSSPASSWILTADGPSILTGPGAAGSTDVSGDVIVGTYALSESSGPSYYSGGSWICTKNAEAPVTGASITLTYSDTAICSITNTYHAPSSGGGGGYYIPSVVPLINVVKIPSTLSVIKGGIVTYTDRVSNPGTVALSNVSITDDRCSPTTYVSGDTNNNSKLDTTEVWLYTCQVNLTQTTTNTVAVSGIANGITAKSSAVATVAVTPIIPKLPKTGFPPEEKSNSLGIIILSGLFVASSILYIIRKKQNA